MLQQENELVRSRGIHWEWSGGNPESMTPFLVLDFNVSKDPNRYAHYVAIKTSVDSNPYMNFEMAKFHFFNGMRQYD